MGCSSAGADDPFPTDQEPAGEQSGVGEAEIGETPNELVCRYQFVGTASMCNTKPTTAQQKTACAAKFGCSAAEYRVGPPTGYENPSCTRTQLAWKWSCYKNECC
jgi:hypothetical protein